MRSIAADCLRRALPQPCRSVAVAADEFFAPVPS
jgi:hypothetical protein